MDLHKKICTFEYIKVLLDEEGIVLEAEITFLDFKYTDKELIGKSWFDMFFDEREIQNEKKAFKELLLRDGYLKYTTDIKCRDEKHKYMDFIINVKTLEDKSKRVEFFGFEHYIW